MIEVYERGTWPKSLPKVIPADNLPRLTDQSLQYLARLPLKAQGNSVFVQLA
jgi:hypothetical protein